MVHNFMVIWAVLAGILAMGIIKTDIQAAYECRDGGTVEVSMMGSECIRGGHDH